MRRWLAIFLLVLLPLQFAWGAAAVYCQHETGPDVRHFGHHTHAHESADGTSAEGSSQAKLMKLLGGDPDCGFCQLGAAKPVVMVIDVPTALGRPVLAAPPTPPLSTRAPDQHERPNWSIA